MKRFPTAFLCLLAPVCAFAGAIQGVVSDRSGAVIPRAHVGLFTATGLATELVTGPNGAFRFDAAPEAAVRVVITADGFATQSIPLPTPNPIRAELSISPASDSIRIIGSTMDVPASEQPSSVSVITSAEIRERNEAQALDLLRTLPGLSVVQNGQRGGATSVFIRGGDSSYALVQIDGVPINSFTGGGLFDFSQVPTDFLDRVELVRGAQSAVYGSYANSGVINFVTRSGDSGTALDLLAEGGSHNERRFAVSGSGSFRGYGLAASASRIDTDNEVSNADWRGENVFLRVNRNWTRQSFSASGSFNSNEEGIPGPYGSDPAGLYPGLDLLTRDKNNTSQYALHYQTELTNRLRAELFGGFFLSNNSYLGQYASYNKDIRGEGEGRLVASLTGNWTMAGGVVWSREESKNTYITDSSFRNFPLRRDEEGIYWENRLQFRKLSVQAGVRGEIFHTPLIPAFDDPYSGRPEIASHTNSRVNPKLAAAYALTRSTRLHASGGTGIRPPGGFELAFTTNPNLKPERSTSVDAGVSQTLLNGRVILDGTFFYNRYSDLIISLGGSIANLSSFSTDNLANARARGTELSAQIRPARWIALSTNYMYLDTSVLALNHSGAAQNYYQVGQQLARRPPHSGSFRVALSKGRVSGDFIGYIRGETLDVEPNYGPTAGFFSNPGYANLSVNLNVSLAHGTVIYGTLRNALNEHYEEAFGYPSPRLNFVSGVKWSFRGRDY